MILELSSPDRYFQIIFEENFFNLISERKELRINFHFQNTHNNQYWTEELYNLLANALVATQGKMIAINRGKMIAINKGKNYSNLIPSRVFVNFFYSDIETLKSEYADVLKCM